MLLSVELSVVEVRTVPEAEGRPTLADNLDRLFDEVRPDGPRGRRYTNEEVAAAVREANPGIRVGGAYLSALRKGTKRNPSTELLGALARFFSVPVSHFLGEERTRQSAAEAELAQVARNLGVRNLALRALELSPEGLAAATEIIEHVLEHGGHLHGSPDGLSPRPRRTENTANGETTEGNTGR